MREGSWWVRSVDDPRWNMDGRGSVGGFEMPVECKNAIEEKKEALGPPPKDLVFEYMKD